MWSPLRRLNAAGLGGMLGVMPAAVLADVSEFGLDELPPVPASSGEMTIVVRLSIYLLIIVLSFSLFLIAVYRATLSRHGMWPGTLYGICLGLFLGTCILAVWPLFLAPYQQLEWVRNTGGPVESMGLQAAVIVGAIVAFLLCWRLYRSQPPQAL